MSLFNLGKRKKIQRKQLVLVTILILQGKQLISLMRAIMRQVRVSVVLKYLALDVKAVMHCLKVQKRQWRR